VSIELEIAGDPADAAGRVAELVAERAQAATGRFSVALSKVPPALVEALELPWERVTVYQVDERLAPIGAPDRNLTLLAEALPVSSLEPMPVDEADLDAAAERYAQLLPARLDLVHLGLGADGHTASLFPGDPVLNVRDRLVAVTSPYEGCRRMTLTYPALEAAREIVWLVTGAGKRKVLSRLLERDQSLPAARIANGAQLVVADPAAAGTESR